MLLNIALTRGIASSINDIVGKALYIGFLDCLLPFKMANQSVITLTVLSFIQYRHLKQASVGSILVIG